MIEPAGGPVFTASASIVMAEIPDGAALLDISSGKYFGLDPVGVAIWRHLESNEPTTLSALVNIVSASFDVAPEACAADIHDFLAALLKARLIGASDAGMAA